MLIVLTISFFIRALLLTIGTIVLVEAHHAVWVPFCTVCVTLYLIFGELVPIATIFWYHLYSSPKKAKANDDPLSADHQSIHSEKSLARKTEPLAHSMSECES